MREVEPVWGFKTDVSSYLEAGGSARTLADEFEAAVSTVDRWSKGNSYPHERIARLVLEWIKERTCKAPQLDCGGSCYLLVDHDGDHLCIGDTDGPGSCPA